MTKNDGGPAFPTGDGTMTDGEQIVTLTHKSGGMTLRDWFAGQMLVGITQTKFGDSLPDQVAKWAYERADAMLAERSKP